MVRYGIGIGREGMPIGEGGLPFDELARGSNFMACVSTCDADSRCEGFTFFEDGPPETSAGRPAWACQAARSRTHTRRTPCGSRRTERTA